MKKQPRKKLQRNAAKLAAAYLSNNGNGGGRTAASLVVTESQLDHMFTSWPLEDKVMCVQSWLDRLEA